jgi:O-antigen ligase
MIASVKSLLKKPTLAILLKNLIKITFQLLILLLPTQLALHFWPSWAYVYGFRIDYLSPTLYLTDILIFVLFALWGLQCLLNRRFVKKHSLSNRINVLLIVLLIGFIGANIYFANSSWVAIYKWIKIGEYILFGLFIAQTKDYNFKNWIAKPLSFSLIIVSIIAFAQFVLQRTVGGSLYLLGERSFNVMTPGIATFTLYGRELLRPYSIFPHPNVLAGFLGVSFYLLLLGLDIKEMRFYHKLALTAAVLVLVLTFSQGAWISFLLVGFVCFFLRRNNHPPKKRYVFGLVIAITMSLLLPAVSDKLLSSHDYVESVNHRLHLAKASGLLISQRPIVGAGTGGFILGLLENPNFPKYSWWLQPVHNVFLLIFAETGFIGLGLYIALLITAFNRIYVKKNKKILMALMLVMLTGLVDHYWITLQQTQILFTLLMGLAFRKKV